MKIRDLMTQLTGVHTRIDKIANKIAIIGKHHKNQHRTQNKQYGTLLLLILYLIFIKPLVHT